MSTFVILIALLSAASSFDLNFLSVPLLEVSEPMVAEIVRWNQPICLEASADLPPCNQASNDADEFDGDGDALDSRSPRSNEYLESSSSQRETPELDISSERSDASRREARFLFQKPVPIFATKVQKVPVTATLVAKNCMPNIDLPFCSESPVKVERDSTAEREEMPEPPSMIQAFHHFLHKRPAATVSTDAQAETQSQGDAKAEASSDDVKSSSKSKGSAKAGASSRRLQLVAEYVPAGASLNPEEWDSKTALKYYINKQVATLSKLWNVEAWKLKAEFERHISDQEAAAAKPAFVESLEMKAALECFIKREEAAIGNLEPKDWDPKDVVDYFMKKHQVFYGKLVDAKESVAQGVANVASGKKQAVSAVIDKKQEVLKTLVDKTQAAVQNIVSKTQGVVQSIVDKKTDLELQLADKKQQLVQSIASAKEKLVGGIASAAQHVVQHVADGKIGAISKVSEKTQEIIGTVSLAKPLLVAPLRERLGGYDEVAASVGADFDQSAAAVDERSAAGAKEAEATEGEEENPNGDVPYVVKSVPT